MGSHDLKQVSPTLSTTVSPTLPSTLSLTLPSTLSSDRISSTLCCIFAYATFYYIAYAIFYTVLLPYLHCCIFCNTSLPHFPRFPRHALHLSHWHTHTQTRRTSGNAHLSPVFSTIWSRGHVLGVLRVLAALVRVRYYCEALVLIGRSREQGDPLKSPFFPIIFPQSDPEERRWRAEVRPLRPLLPARVSPAHTRVSRLSTRVSLLSSRVSCPPTRVSGRACSIRGSAHVGAHVQGRVGRSMEGFGRMVKSLFTTENFAQFSSWTQVPAPPT